MTKTNKQANKHGGPQPGRHSLGPSIFRPGSHLTAESMGGHNPGASLEKQKSNK